MKQLLLATCLAAAFTHVFADELTVAAKLHEDKNFAQAVQLYTKLAKAGNVEAQLQLGDIYGFGDGVEENPGEAIFWLNKAAEKGNKDALVSLQTLKQRATRKADIEYYTNKYDGIDARLSKFNCIEPSPSLITYDKKQIIKVSGEFNAWFDCYDRFIDNLNNSLPPGKVIPAEVVSVMSNAEFLRASAAMDKQYTVISTEAQKLARKIRLEYDNWLKASEIAVTEAKKEYEALEQIRAKNRTSTSERDISIKTGRK